MGVMNEKGIKGYIAWLGDNLLARRHSLAALLERMRDVCMHAASNLSLYKKFMKLLEQVAGDREKEIFLIDEIEAVERRHAEMRKMKLLRRAQVSSSDKDAAHQNDQPEQPQRSGIWKLIGMFYLLSLSSKKKPEVK